MDSSSRSVVTFTTNSYSKYVSHSLSKFDRLNFGP